MNRLAGTVSIIEDLQILGILFTSYITPHQSWAHRSYKLSERSKAMSDLWFSEWKTMSVERWANCQKKEFAHRSKRSLNLKERAF
jgi:hypothetical protein